MIGMKSDVSLSPSLRVIAQQAKLVSNEDKHLEACDGGDGQQEEADFHQRSSHCRLPGSPHSTASSLAQTEQSCGVRQ